MLHKIHNLLIKIQDLIFTNSLTFTQNIYEKQIIYAHFWINPSLHNKKQQCEIQTELF